MTFIKNVLPKLPHNYVRDWREYVPKESHWTPGSPGDPGCRTCLGTGWLRDDLPLGHPQFGKLQACDCQAKMKARRV